MFPFLDLRFEVVVAEILCIVDSFLFENQCHYYCVCALQLRFNRFLFVFGFCEHGEGRLNNNDACWGMHWNTEFCGVNAWEGVRRKDSVLIGTSKLLFLV